VSKTNSTSNNVDKKIAENLAQDMSDLMHDFEVVSRINSLIGTFKCSYPELTKDCTSSIMESIQKSIRQKDEEMSWLDKCCLQLVVKKEDKSEQFTFQMCSPAVRQDWVVDLRCIRLALDPSNSPGWDVLEKSKLSSARLPLYVKHITCYHSEEQKNTEVVCGSSYTLNVETPTRTLRPVTYVWAAATNGSSSYLQIYSTQVAQQISLKELGTIQISGCLARSVIYVPGILRIDIDSSGDSALSSDLIWVATDDQRILLYAASEPERGFDVGRIMLAEDPLCQVFHNNKVFIGLVNGCVEVFKRDNSFKWDLYHPMSIQVGQDPITCMLPIHGGLYVACGKHIHTFDTMNHTVTRKLHIEAENSLTTKGSLANLLLPANISSGVSYMAVCGIGLWVSMVHSSTIALYHTESFIHLQDINIANNVSRVLDQRGVPSNKRSVYVTAMSASRGMLWVGTNVGIALTIPLPRLEGVPIISGKANISYHAHFGPVRMFLPLQPKVQIAEAIVNPIQADVNNSTKSRKQTSYSGLSNNLTPMQVHAKQSPSFNLQRSKSSVSSKDLVRKTSKTLPRSFAIGQGIDNAGESVFGLYEDLMNVEEYECNSTQILDGSNKDIHNSDPELDTISYRVGTLDRRVAMKSQRPRSLDLSTWSVTSRVSNLTTSSSDGSQKASPNVSRTASFASDTNTSESSWSSNTKTFPKTPQKEKNVKGGGKPPKCENAQRTITTLMGGRGYIPWRATHLENQSHSFTAINNSDACLVVWDYKLL